MKLFCLALIASVGICIGCGPSATDTSGAAPPKAPEEITKDLEKAKESGKIDPATYGKSK